MDVKASGKGCPVNFDHESEYHARNWPQEYDEMRGKCPVSWTEKHGGYWVATGYKTVVEMGQDGATFSSFKTFDPATGGVTGGITIPATPIPRGLPVEADRPEWDMYRGFINSRFGPKAAEGRRDEVRMIATALVNRVIEKGEMDLVNDFTGPLPAMTTMALMGIPLEEWRDFADPLHEMVFTPKEAPNYMQVIGALGHVFKRCVEVFEQKRKEPPGEGLLSYFAHEKINGRYLEADEVLSYCNNILPGGVDTTTALTTNSLIYLHDHPADKKRLMDNPEMMPVAREEFLRFFSPLHSLARTVTRDVDVAGQHMEKGDQVLLCWSGANRDPEIFENPDRINLERFPNRHIAFGAGVHRCIGSFLARVMFEEMVKQVFDRMPEYSIDKAAGRQYTSVGTINGWVDMPMTFKPGVKVACDLVL